MTTSASSNTTPTPDGATIEVALRLGSEIAANLDTIDTVGRWMAHYLGDLLARAEHVDGDERADLNREVATLVLDLWTNRARLPMGQPIFERYDQIFQTLDRISERAAGFPTRGVPSKPLPHDGDGWFELRLGLLVEIAGRTAQFSRQVLAEVGERAHEDEARWTSYLDDFPDAHTSGLSQFIARYQGWAGDPDLAGNTAIATLRDMAAWATSAADEMQASKGWTGSPPRRASTEAPPARRPRRHAPRVPDTP